MLSSYFHKNKNSGGIVESGTIGELYTNVTFSPDKEYNIDEIIKENKKERKRRKLNLKKPKKLYAILEDGMVHYILDSDRKFTVLRTDNYNSYFLGKSKIRNSTRAQIFRKPSWRCSLIYASFKKHFDLFGVDVDKCVIIEGCYSSNMHTLQRTMTFDKNLSYNKYPNSYNIGKFDNAVRAMFRKFKMYGVLPTQSFDDVYETEIGLNKKPGYRFEECFRMLTKGEALPYAIKIAKKRWDYLEGTKPEDIEHTKLHKGVYTIGARNKRDYSYDDGELAVSRAVHMPELHVELTSAPWCDAFIERIKKVAKGPLYLGNSFLQWDRLKNDIKDSSYVIEGDFKRFDSTLYLAAITCATAIMRCMFDLDDIKVDSHFIGQYDSLSIKDYYVVGGNVYRLYHGLPSGVKSTSILGSIICMLSLLFCCGKYNSKKFNFIIGGDDFLIVCNANIIKEKLIDSLSERVSLLGMLFKFLDVKYFKSNDVRDLPVFFKYTVYKDKPIIPTSALLERAFMPWNKKYKTDADLLKFLWDIMPSTAYPMSHHYLYYIFLQYMHKSVTGRFLKLSKIYKIHLNLYKRMQKNKDVGLIKQYKFDSVDDKKGVVSLILLLSKVNFRVKFNEALF